MRDGLEIGVQDGAFGVEGLAVAIRAGGGWVKALSELVLSLGRSMRLAFEDQDLVLEQCVVNDRKVGV